LRQHSEVKRKGLGLPGLPKDQDLGSLRKKQHIPSFLRDNAAPQLVFGGLPDGCHRRCRATI